MKAHAGEETGHQEEGRHPEDMDGEGQQAHEQAWMGVLDEPEPGRGRHERHCRVQDDAEQQGAAPERIEGVEPF